CPLGAAYLPAYPAGARTGIRELAPKPIGCDPTALGMLNRTMDAAMRGHPYVKSAIAMSCWDILCQACDQPVVSLLGGRYSADSALYRSVSQEASEDMAASVARYRAEGYTKFQLKVGGEADTDIERIHARAATLERGGELIARANTGCLMHQVARDADAVRSL